MHHGEYFIFLNPSTGKKNWSLLALNRFAIALRAAFANIKTIGAGRLAGSYVWISSAIRLMRLDIIPVRRLALTFGNNALYSECSVFE